MRNKVYYRVNNGPCQEGYQEAARDCDPAVAAIVWTGAIGGVPVVGAVATAPGACPQEVVVVPSPPPPTPVAAPAVSCDADTTVQAVNLLSQAVHQAPGTAFNVKICPSTPKLYDREMLVLCAPDGTKVMVQNVTAEDAPLGTAPVFEAWTLSGEPYTGAIATLKDCGAEKIDLTSAEWFCASGVPILRSDAWDISVSPRALVGSIWQDVSGAVVPAPAAGSYVVGDCSCVSVPQGVLVTWG